MKHVTGGETALLADFLFFKDDNFEEDPECDGPFRSQEFVLFVHLEGTVQGKIDLQEIEINQPTVVLLAPNAVKQMLHRSTDCKHVGFAFNSTFLTRLGLPKHIRDIFELMAEIRFPMLKLEADELEQVLVYMKNIELNYYRVRKHLYAEEIIHSNVLSLLYELADVSLRQNNPTPRRVSRKESIVTQFGALAIKHFRDRKQLQYYADEVFVTPKYLTETVKEVTGRTAGEILDGLLIREAKILLKNPDVSISQVASSLNFSDQSFFGKYFKRHTGHSPRAFRGSSVR